MTAEPIVLDSVTHLTKAHHGSVAYCASHGAIYAAYYAASKGVSAVVLNDAGIGRERAGVSGLDWLDRCGLPGATVSSRSARIGDGCDGLESGIISEVNAIAAEHGITIGMRCRDALARLAALGLPPAPAVTAENESRFLIPDAGGHGIRVVAVDSASLIAPDDARNIVVTGSHGGVLGGKPATAAKYDVVAAVYNDAGFGKDDAGISRLPALDTRGIAAACVSCFSARIGDGMSSWIDGYVSAVNATAERSGARIGQSTREFAAAIIAAAGRR